MMKKRTALVVGASRGIGLAITRQLLCEAQIERVYATYRNAETASQLLEINDDRLLKLGTDITLQQDLESLATDIRRRGDRPDFIINCAGILHEGDLQPEKSLRQCDQEMVIDCFNPDNQAATGG